MSEGKGAFKIARWSSQQQIVMPQEVKNGGKDTMPLDVNALVEGKLYLCKIKFVKLSLFEGCDDDMYCFSLLREEASPMRWSEARYLASDFSAYEAFDSSGNPPISLWRKNLKEEAPRNWFDMYEEARRKQRSWNQIYDDASPNGTTFNAPHPPSSPPPSGPPSKRGSTYFRPTSEANPLVDSVLDRERMRSHILGDEDGAPTFSPQQSPVARTAGPFQPQLNQTPYVIDNENEEEDGLPEVDEEGEGVINGESEVIGTMAVSPDASETTDTAEKIPLLHEQQITSSFHLDQRVLSLVPAMASNPTVVENPRMPIESFTIPPPTMAEDVQPSPPPSMAEDVQPSTPTISPTPVGETGEGEDLTYLVQYL